MTVYRNKVDLQSEDWDGLVDTHCHLDLEPLHSRLTDVLSEARRVGVTSFIVPGVHPDGWERMSSLPRQHRGVFLAFGIHPMHADTADESTLQRLAVYASHGVAIGEIGLDPSCAIPMDRQERAFRDQLRLAVARNLPVLVHCRRAFRRTLRVLSEEGASRVGGIMHAFSGSLEMAHEFIRLGFTIGLCGTVTWENALRPVRLAREIPLESLVLETDAPDLAPRPFRGQPNHPGLLVHVLEAVARARAVPPREVAQATGNTSQRILKRLRTGFSANLW